MELVNAIRYLQAGEWQRAHAIVQDDGSPFGCWAHGIVHMMEGDIDNARYWYRRAHREYPGASDPVPEIEALVRAMNENSAKDSP